QINAKKYATGPDAELKAVLDLSAEAIRAGFYNIDVDTSTLVDLSKPTHAEQQALNGRLCAEIAAFIRRHEPEGVTISVGGELCGEFTKRGACEIHLATEFQNMIFDDPAFPADLKRRIYDELRVSEAADRKPTDTDEQFFYKVRKKALGAHKQDLWSLPAAVRAAIAGRLEERFTFLLTQLRVPETRAL